MLARSKVEQRFSWTIVEPAYVTHPQMLVPDAYLTEARKLHAMAVAGKDNDNNHRPMYLHVLVAVDCLALAHLEGRKPK